jgi:S-adenosylmethionine:tRNA ribosyltransferase-isomerase
MRLEDFDFELPKSSVAVRPASPRDSARLLVVEGDKSPPFKHAHVRDFPDFLTPGDVVILNDTKVLPCVVSGKRLARMSGGPEPAIEMLLVERLQDGSWKALARPARRLQPGDVVTVSQTDPGTRLVIRSKGDGGEVTVASATGISIETIMGTHGLMPIPPYIARTRSSDERDFSDYQTTFAKTPGAVAAPTAGLHFTPDLMDRIANVGVKIAFITLHVGLGTFSPIKDKEIGGQRLHEERCELTAEVAAAINAARANGGRVVAVGTTTLRVLETAAREDGSIAPFAGATDLFIKPGHVFRSADILLTNFHLPRSTLFMLVCAFSGTAIMKQAYDHAIREGFRFYSYGDACLLHRGQKRP